MLFVETLRKKTNKVNFQLFRYILVGGVAFLFDVTILYLLTEFAHLNYLLSAMIGYMVGLTITYLFSIHWVFDTRKIKTKRWEFIIFVAIGIVGLGLNELFIWLITQYFMLYYLLSKGITTVIVFIWNFSAKKLVLFR